MGQLTDSTIHELKNTIAATILNAKTALRWLDGQPPSVEKAQQAIDRVVADGKRAAKLVGRLPSVKKHWRDGKDAEINETMQK